MAGMQAGPLQVGRKKKPEARTRQLNVRLPEDLAERLDRTAKMLATDISHLVRMILAEKLGEYETRGRRAQGLPDPGPSTPPPSQGEGQP